MSGTRHERQRPVLLVENGAEGQSRTADTTIFSRVLYQLSYLGTPGRSANGRAVTV